MEDRGTALIAWSKVCRPKKQGGLGILDISIHNKALLMKNLLKFLNKEDIPWINLIWEKYYHTELPRRKLEGSFWWKSHIALLERFKQISKCSIGSGQSILCWSDTWLEQQLQSLLPHLHSFALHEDQSVLSFFQEENWIDQFHLPLSVEAFEEFNQLPSLAPTLDPQVKDRWNIIGASGRPSSILIYNLLLDNHEEHPFFSLIWDSSSRLKHKIFFWLVAHCRINTRALLLRKGMHLDDIFCPNCNQQAEETPMHLLWDCSFAQDCWNSLIPNRRRGTSVYEDTILATQLLPKQFVVEILILGCWNIWIQRNNFVFRALPHSIQSWRYHLKNDLKLLRHKIKQKFTVRFSQWIDHNL